MEIDWLLVYWIGFGLTFFWTMVKAIQEDIDAVAVVIIALVFAATWPIGLAFFLMGKGVEIIHTIRSDGVDWAAKYDQEAEEELNRERRGSRTSDPTAYGSNHGDDGLD